MNLVSAVDFEAFYSDKVSIKVQGTQGYLRHPECDVYLASVVRTNGQEFVGHPLDFDWEAIAEDEWVSHNTSFDHEVYVALKEKFPKERWPMPRRWHCSSDMAAFFGVGRSLKEATKQLLKVEMSKDTRNRMKGLQWADMDEEMRKEVMTYGLGDSRYCLQLWMRFSWLWPEFEQRLSLLTREMGWRGVYTDLPRLKEAQKLLDRLRWAAEQKIPWAGQKDEKGEEIPTLSKKTLAIWCREKGIEPPVNMAKDDPAFDLWLEKYDAQYPVCRAMSEYRRIDTVLGKIETMINRTQENGRMPFNLKYGGAHTLRWSGDGGLNMQNLQKEPLYVTTSDVIVRDPVVQEEITSAKKKGREIEWLASSIDLRACIIAPPGKKLGITDLSQIEPRVLWWLAGDTAALALAASGMSPYEVHARVSMGWTGGELKVEDPRKYALAKARVLALGYQAGWHKFFGMAKTYGVPDSVFDDELADGVQAEFEEYLQSLKNKSQWNVYNAASPLLKHRYTNAWLIVIAFRESNPKITNFWAEMEFKMRCAAIRRQDWEVELPSGRIMRYREPKVTGKSSEEEEGEKIRRKKNPEDRPSGLSAKVVKDGHLAAVHFYGGKLAENITQAVARDVFSWAKLNVIDAGYRDIVLEVHDELVNELELHQSVKDIEAIMSQTPPWLPGCPVAAEGKESLYYKK